jgi:YidC/Oxa1 family membrane protein insertase
MDRRALLAVALSFLVLFGSQWVFQKLGWMPAPPKAGAPSAQGPARGGTTPGTTPSGPNGAAGTNAPSDRAATPAGTSEATGGNPSAPGSATLSPDVPAGASMASRWAAAPSADSIVTVTHPLYTARFRPRGARLLSVELLKYKDGDHGRATLAANPALALDLGDPDAEVSLADVPYAVEESLDASGRVSRLTFTARDTAGFSVAQTYRFSPDDYRIAYTVSTTGPAPIAEPGRYHLTLRSWPLLTERTRLEDLNNLGITSKVGKDNKRELSAALRGGPKNFEGSITWVAIHSKYFLLGLVGQNVQGLRSRAELAPDTPPEQHDAVEATLTLPLPAGGQRAHAFTLWAGPLDYWRVDRIGMDLEPPHAIFFNLFKPFSAFLVWLMKQFHALIHNWGVAIILLSIAAKAATHPLQATSMKSMRAMQKIQPELERLRKKHEKDPQKMNTAIMELYKENNINPLAGCLPMLIQMPFFLALYHVLGYAIDLRQAGFVGWITDLSAPDLLFQLGPLPIRVLPLLMLGSMILQMRMSPTDPKQAMTMQLVNVVFLFLFYNLPSGLVLYWTVINLLTALQSWMVARGDVVPKAKAA